MTFAGSRGELRALVVDLLHVALGAGRADDVVGGVDHPLLEPVEAFPAHPLRQDGDAPALHEPGDGHAAPAVVAGGRPDRAMHGRVELPGDDARRQTAVGRQHLVGADHREPVPERHDDPRVDAGQLGRQHDVVGDADQAGAVVPVEPVDPEQVQRVGLVGPNAVERRAIRPGTGRGPPAPRRSAGRCRHPGTVPPSARRRRRRPGPLQPERAHGAREYADWTIPTRRAEGPPFGGPAGPPFAAPGAYRSRENRVAGLAGGFGRWNSC